MQMRFFKIRIRAQKSVEQKRSALFHMTYLRGMSHVFCVGHADRSLGSYYATDLTSAPTQSYWVNVEVILDIYVYKGVVSPYFPIAACGC